MTFYSYFAIINIFIASGFQRLWNPQVVSEAHESGTKSQMVEKEYIYL